jgi:hypothetical protein
MPSVGANLVFALAYGLALDDSAIRTEDTRNIPSVFHSRGTADKTNGAFHLLSLFIVRRTIFNAPEPKSERCEGIPEQHGNIQYDRSMKTVMNTPTLLTNPPRT